MAKFMLHDKDSTAASLVCLGNLAYKWNLQDNEKHVYLGVIKYASKSLTHNL